MYGFSLPEGGRRRAKWEKGKQKRRSSTSFLLPSYPLSPSSPPLPPSPLHTYPSSPSPSFSFTDLPPFLPPQGLKTYRAVLAGEKDVANEEVLALQTRLDLEQALLERDKRLAGYGFIKGGKNSSSGKGSGEGEGKGKSWWRF